MDERNQLTRELRAQIISLSMWVSKYSKQVTREGASIEPLIEINRTIMQGLQGAYRLIEQGQPDKAKAGLARGRLFSCRAFLPGGNFCRMELNAP